MHKTIASFLDLNSDPSSDKVVFKLPLKEFHECQNKAKKNEIVILNFETAKGQLFSK